MLLFREVYGWLKYLIAKDPICRSHGIAVEEIFSTFAPFSDTNDGVRTLVIHRVQDGMTPRIEYRAVGLHPQIFWYPAGASDGELLAITNQFGFSGDYKSWDCSDTCDWLLKTAQAKLGMSLDAPQPVSITLTAAAVLPMPTMIRILDAANRAVEKKTRLSQDGVNTFIKKEHAGLTVDALRDSLIHYLSHTPTKNENPSDTTLAWEDTKVMGKPVRGVKNLIACGVIEGALFKRFIKNNDLEGKFTPANMAELDKISSEQKKNESTVSAHFERILGSYAKGKNWSRPLVDIVSMGQEAIAQFKVGKIPYQYLQQLSLADPYETVLPWSFIRRSVLSYSKKIQADAGIEGLPALVVSWLKDSHLLLLLYKGEKEQEEALSKAIEAQVQYYVKQTIGNDYWMRSLLGQVSNASEGKLNLQVEFDLWLLDALSPAVDRLKVPLSPHAFSADKKDQDTYDKIYRAWMTGVQGYLKTYKGDSGPRLTDSFSKFFSQLIAAWKTEELKNYKAKIPSATKILESVGKGTPEDLLGILCEDFEHEVGSQIPSEVRDSLLRSPYFYAIMHEVKIQGLRLD